MHKLILTSLLFSLHLPVVYGQAQSTYCNAGVQPDAFVDWSGLPAGSNTDQKGSAVPTSTITLPVSGGNGLTVDVTLPGYRRLSNTDLLVYGSNTTVTLHFNHPVNGVSLIAKTFGRFGHTFDIQAREQAPDPAGGTGPFDGTRTFNNSSSGSEQPSLGETISTPLEVAGPSSSINYVLIKFNGDVSEYFAFTISNLRVQTANAPDPAQVVPTAGLKQWLRADKGLTFSDDDPGNPTMHRTVRWADQSGSGNDAAANSPNQDVPVIIDGRTCRPTVSFPGNVFFTFNLPIDGWTGMTVFLVSNAYDDASAGPSRSQHAAIFWEENLPWGNTYLSPFQTHADFRFGTTQAWNFPDYLRTSTAGGDFTVTTAVHDGSSDSLFGNSVLLLREGGKIAALNGTTGTGFLGKGLGNTFFNGGISEVLVYDRAVSEGERVAIERYLTTKYGVQ